MSSSSWLPLVPFVLILGIFYFIILLPMKRKQQKVQQFLDSLKVGDRVITTGGIYGQVTKLGDQSVQLQVADKIRIEVARAAIGGYQGQPPVVERSRVRSCRTCAGKSSRASSPSSSSPPSASIRSWPSASASPRRSGCIDRALKLGLDLKGGVHLVLRVQTDDALKLETEAEDGAAARGLADRRAFSRQHHAGRRRPSSRSKASPPTRTPLPSGRGRGGDQLRSQLRRRRHLHVHPAAERAADAARRGGRRRRGRRSSGASTSWASPSRASRSRAPTAIRFWSSCRA